MRKGVYGLPQLSGTMSWTSELFKLYGWYPGQKYLKTDQNSLKAKQLVHGLFRTRPIGDFPMLNQRQNV